MECCKYIVLLSALVCEQRGLLDKALEYTAAIWDGDLQHDGGGTLLATKSLAHSVQGRVRARQGNFEAATIGAHDLLSQPSVFCSDCFV